LTREVKFLSLAMKLVMEENRYFSSIDANWMDLRHEKNHNGQLYWCHGAPGIALARAMSIQYGDQEDNNVLENDLEVAVEKLKKQGFENSLSHCLCHGVIGNLDILLEIATMRKDDVLKSSALKIGESILEDILEHGIKFSAPLNIETINFMIGLSGIGYCMLRLNNVELPSVLRLDVF